MPDKPALQDPIGPYVRITRYTYVGNHKRFKIERPNFVSESSSKSFRWMRSLPLQVLSASPGQAINLLTCVVAWEN
jgi:hypothetical protein